MESNEDTFKPDIVFDSFHHQAKIPISDEALLAGFLMMWLKRCIVPTLPHEVVVADVVYLTVLLLWSVSRLSPRYGRLSLEQASSSVSMFLQCSS